MSPNIWATFVRKFVVKNFQKSPNLVTLFSTLLNYDSKVKLSIKLFKA